MLMVWENVWPALPHGLMLFFRRPPLLLAVFCFVSFLLTTPYTTGVSNRQTHCLKAKTEVNVEAHTGVDVVTTVSLLQFV